MSSTIKTWRNLQWKRRRTLKRLPSQTTPAQEKSQTISISLSTFKRVKTSMRRRLRCFLFKNLLKKLTMMKSQGQPNLFKAHPMTRRSKIRLMLDLQSNKIKRSKRKHSKVKCFEKWYRNWTDCMLLRLNNQPINVKYLLSLEARRLRKNLQGN